MSVVFFHPDLGIGGAERLIIDAAVALESRNRVTIFTSHCDPHHSFDECRTLDVRVHGDWLPTSLLRRLTVLFAILRQLLLILQVSLSGELRALRPRAFIVDQLSAGLPLLRLLYPDVPILFYCHFPDLLLARGRESALKRLYRAPFDRLEAWSMGFAHAVAVNSRFTKSIVDATWPALSQSVDIRVLYPCVDTAVPETIEVEQYEPVSGRRLMLSINRFERKKDVGLAIRAFAAIPPEERSNVCLVLAGGYDHRVAENVEYHTELQDLASSLDLTHQTISPSSSSSAASLPNVAVLFLLSVPASLKAALLRAASLLLYTPANEHFGIVPLEAMLARLPVLACDSGGPVETILDGRTGWLRDPTDVEAWTIVMRRVLRMEDRELERMGDEGVERVRNHFGRENLAVGLEALLDDLRSKKTRHPSWAVGVLAALALALAFYVFA